MYPLNNMTSLTVLQMPDRMVDSAWLGHIPFAMWVVQELIPKVTVELGVHNGASLCAMLQAASNLNQNGRFFGVDSWVGDVHSGDHLPNVYWDLRSFQLQRYRSNSELIKKPFDDATDDFENGSIDLLHIDGCHTYEAVKHDFDRWLPKVRSGGIIMLHDTCVLDNDFGVHKLWSELRTEYPSFGFDHAYGLGVLRVGPSRAENNLDDLFESCGTNDENLIKSYFTRLGQAIMIKHDNMKILKETASLQQKSDAAKNECAQLHELVSSLRTALTFAGIAEASHLKHIANLEVALSRIP